MRLNLNQDPAHTLLVPLVGLVVASNKAPEPHAMSELWGLHPTISITFRNQQSDKNARFMQPLARCAKVTKYAGFGLFLSKVGRHVVQTSSSCSSKHTLAFTPSHICSSVVMKA